MKAKANNAIGTYAGWTKKTGGTSKAETHAQGVGIHGGAGTKATNTMFQASMSKRGTKKAK